MSSAALLSIALAGVAVTGIVRPDALLRLLARMQSQHGLWIVAGIRLLYGLALFAASGASKAPNFMGFLGALVILAAVATPFFGVERYRLFTDWWAERGVGFIRIWCGVAVLFLLWVAWLAQPPLATS